MQFQLIPLLRCPTCTAQTLEPGAVEESQEAAIVRGTLRCRSCHRESRIDGSIWLAIGDRKPQRSIAQLLNVVPPTPQLYEKLWRHRSLGLISRGATSTQTELSELREWFAPPPPEPRVIVDVACSEGLYARTLEDPTTTVIAVDHSVPFLRRVVERSAGRKIVAVQAMAQHLPIGTASVDGVVMGASLNEIGDRVAAVAEMARVTKPGGRMFSMSLIAASTRGGRLAQKLAGTGGVVFPTLDETTTLFTASGFTLGPPNVDGVVARVSGQRSSY